MQPKRNYFFLLFVLGLTVLALLVFRTARPSYGLDIKGGTRLIYRVLPSKGTNLTTDEARRRAIAILTNRASGMAGEPIVAERGIDQIMIELPGIDNLEEAIKQIGSSARIMFYHARNVVNPQDSNRTYEAIANDSETNPVVRFRRANSDKIIEPGTPEYEQVIAGWRVILEGEDLARASAEPVPPDGYRPAMEFSSAGARKLARWSSAYLGKEENLGVVLDGRVISLTHVEKNAQLSTNAVITGTFSSQYVRSLTDLLNGGSLPADLKLEGSSSIAASAGEQAFRTMVIAGLASFALISLFLIVYYSFPGIVALVALVLYSLFTITAMMLIGATFSLATIAGFILSIGMAVDANILVFERFKEEMRGGRPLRVAIEIGFKRALPAIVDSNICTILTSLVLMSVGTGPVRGFATSLVIGVMISLFTAVTVTRSLLMFLVGSGVGQDSRWYAVDRDWFGSFIKGGTILPIIQKYKLWFIISLATVLIGVPFIGGTKFSVELTGGLEAEYKLSGNPSRESIEQKLKAAGIEGASIRFSSSVPPTALISVKSEVLSKLGSNPSDQADAIAKAAGFSPSDRTSVNTVGAVLQKEVVLGAINGLLISVALIISYLALRFGFAIGGFKEGLKFGLSAIGALVHDILVVIMLAAFVGWIFHWEIGQLFLTAMLTIIGFSVHDTIVIFDRIRENLQHAKGSEDLEHLMNSSITQTFSRSLNTSGTVILTLIILSVFGTTSPELKFFVVAMLIGILSGTYSSIFNASPILYLWDKWTVKKKGEAAGLVGLARAEAARMAAGIRRASDGSSRVGPATSVMASGADGAAGGDGRTYGQVRRRARDRVKDSWQELD